VNDSHARDWGGNVVQKAHLTIWGTTWGTANLLRRIVSITDGERIAAQWRQIDRAISSNKRPETHSDCINKSIC